MKRVFVSELDTLLGQQICEKFGKLGDFDIIGTVRDPAFLEDGLPKYVKSIAPSYREDNVDFKAQVLDSDVIICPLKDDITEANAAIRMLANTASEVEKTFVLVSSVLTWGNTLAAQKAEEAAEREAERQALIEAGEEPDDEPEADPEDEEPEELPVYSDDMYKDRIPTQRYQHWKELEVLVKQVNSETLHTYVVFAGLTYGCGEELMHPLFRAAWHHQPLPLLTDGTNSVPTIHVSDLANIVMKLGSSADTLDTRYFVGVDRGQNTLGQIVGSLNEFMGTGKTVAVSELQRNSEPYSDIFCTDLKFEPGAVFDVHDEEDWVAPDGFVAAAEQVTAEFKRVRGVEPIQAVFLGPPHAGKSFVASEVSKYYSINRYALPDIIANFEAHVSDLESQLAEYRSKRKAERLKAEKEERRRLRKEAAEEAAAEAESAAEAVRAEREDDEDGEEVVNEGQDDADNGEDNFSDISFETMEPPKDEPARDEEDGAVEGGAEEDEAAEQEDEGADDDEEDEALAKLKDDIAQAKQVLALKVRIGGPPPKDEDDEDDVDEEAEEAEEVPEVPQEEIKMRFIDEALAFMVRWQLNEKGSRNEGYALDGFPKTVRQAMLTFGGEEVPLPEVEAGEEPPVPADDEEEDPQTILAAVEEKLLPRFVFVLNADEALLKARCEDSDESGHRTLGNFYRRLREYKATHQFSGKPHKSVVGWFRAILTNTEGNPRDLSVVPVDVSSADEADEAMTDVLDSVKRTVGEPHIYKPTPEMIVEEAKAEALRRERLELEALQKAEEAQRLAAEAEEAKQKAAAKHQRRYTSIEEEQQLAADMRDLELQTYLMQYLVPAVTRSMKEVVALRPEDPVDSLANLLFDYKSKTNL